MPIKRSSHSRFKVFKTHRSFSSIDQFSILTNECSKRCSWIFYCPNNRIRYDLRVSRSTSALPVRVRTVIRGLSDAVSPFPACAVVALKKLTNSISSRTWWYSATPARFSSTERPASATAWSMGAASSAKPIEGPKTPMELVASLKKFVEATEVNFDDAFCNREDIDLFIGGLNVIMQHAKVVRELTPEAKEEAVAAVEANPDAMWEAADKGEAAPYVFNWCYEDCIKRTSSIEVPDDLIKRWDCVRGIHPPSCTM